jgi:hypothetical protein
MKRILQTVDGEETVHWDSPHCEFALCGDQIIETDCRMSIGKPTRKPVTCERCLAVARHVKLHRSNNRITGTGKG